MFWEFFQHIQAVLRRGSCHQRLRIDRIWTVRRQSNATVCTESGGLQDDPLDNAGADAERPGNLEDGRVVRSQCRITAGGLRAA